MKQLFIVLGLFLILCNLYADENVTISNEIFTHEQMSRKDFTDRMAPFGAKVVENSNTLIHYQGDIEVDSYHYSDVYAHLSSDTLWAVVCMDQLNAGKKEAAHVYAEQLKGKYQSLLEFSEKYLIVPIRVDSLAKVYKFDKNQTWYRRENREGGNAVVVVTEKKRLCTCYLNYSRCFISAISETMRHFMDVFGPDLDEKNKVTGVSGILFGTPRNEVIEILSGRGARLVYTDHVENTYCNFTLGGYMYDYAHFCFAQNPESHKEEFITAIFEKSFSPYLEEEAKQWFQLITSQYASKYTNERRTEDKNSKLYVYGKLDKGEYPILISLQKSLNNVGNYRWYVRVYYYMHKLQLRDNNEI